MTTKIEENPEEKFVLEMSRQFAASRERVFDAFSNYEAMALWFGPHGCHVSEGEIDFTVGGKYRLQVQGENNEVNTVGGIFQEIVPPERLVFTWRWEPNGENSPEEMEVVINFIKLESGKSELRLRQTLVPNQEVAEQHGWGWGETFERLETSLMT